MKKIFILTILFLLCFGSLSATTYYLWRYRTHATDCTSLTDGKATDLCYEQDDQALYKCVPSSGDCDTPAEWKTAGDGSGTGVSYNFTSPLTNTSYTVAIPKATSTADGYLNMTDWSTFNAKGTGTSNYTNFTNNETANINWAHTFNASQLQVGGINVTTTEIDPTVDSSAEIVAIIGAGVYEPAGVAVADITDASANGRSLISATDYAAMKGLLDLEIGTDVQAQNAVLTELTALTDPAADRLVFWNDTSNNFEFLDYSGWDVTAYTDGDFLTLTGHDFDVDTAAVTNGDTTHLSTADAIYDFVAGGYQPLEATLTDIADGTITEDLVNTANPWADNEVSDTLTSSTCTGNAATVTTNANLTGEVTSVGNAATIADSLTVTSWTLTTPTLVGGVTINNGATSSGTLDILEDSSDGAEWIRLQVPALAANITYTLPSDNGDAGEQLQTDGAGVLTWEAAGAAGGETLAQTLAIGADANDVDTTSWGKMEGFDAGLYLDWDADGVIDLTSDGTLELHSADWDISTTGAITGASLAAADNVIEADTCVGLDTEAEIEAITGALFGASKVVTAGYIWVADGTDFESVPMSGDVSIASGGATTVANDSHTHVAANISDANAGTDITADLEEEVTEGSLADSVIVSADIKDGVIADADMLATDDAMKIQFTFVFDGGGSEIADAKTAYVRIPANCTITGWDLAADASGAIKIDVWVDTYANYPPADADTITAAHEPEIAASATKAQDTDITDWGDVTLAAGSYMKASVDTCTTITYAVLIIYGYKT